MVNLKSYLLNKLNTIKSIFKSPTLLDPFESSIPEEILCQTNGKRNDKNRTGIKNILNKQTIKHMANSEIKTKTHKRFRWNQNVSYIFKCFWYTHMRADLSMSELVNTI